MSNDQRAAGPATSAAAAVTPTPAAPAASGVPWKVLLGITIALMVAYLIVLGVLFSLADNTKEEVVWARYTVIFAGFEAIVFTAVGWLFGREVNRKQAEQAEKATEEAKEKGEEAAEARTQGKALKDAILSINDGGIGPAGANTSGLANLKSFAEKFPF